MNDKSLAILGVVVLFVGACAAMAFAHEASAITQIALTVSVGAGVVVNLWRLGNNTDKTEQVARSVNGLTDARVEAAYREAYARGRVDGAQDEAKRRAEELVAKTAAEVVAATVVAAAVNAKENKG